MSKETNIVQKATDLFSIEIENEASNEDKEDKFDLNQNHEKIHEKINEVKEAQQSIKSNHKENETTISIDTQDKSEEDFIENNKQFLSRIEPLKNLEIKYKQTIEINDQERKNPNAILNFLETIKSEFNIELETTLNKDLFKQTPQGKSTFDKILENQFQEQVLPKAITRLYVYFVLLKRRAMTYNTENFKHLSKNYNFDLKDINELKDIDAHCFADFNDIPSYIVKRCQQSAESYQKIADDYIRQFKKLMNFYTSKIEEKINVAESEESKSEKEKRILNLESELRKAENNIEKLSYDVYDELLKNQKITEPQSDEIVSFISDFTQYAIEVNNSLLEKKNHVHRRNDGTFYVTDKDIIKSKQLDDIFFQDTTNLVWVRAREVIIENVWRISGIRNLNNSNKENILQQVAQKIVKRNQNNVIAFKPNAIFVQNGVIELNMNGSQLNGRQFLKNKDLDSKTMMLKYPTYYRVDIIFDPTVDMDFDNYSTGHKVTVSPSLIFNSLGRRGYEVYDYMNQDEQDSINREAYERTNLIKQFVLNMLVLYSDLPIIGKKFLYLYNASNSGKTTFMELLMNMMGVQNELGATTLDVAHLDTKKSEFGLVNIKDKFFVAIDEATDGGDTIETTTLKKIVTKTLKIKANKKNSDFVSFYPQASVMLASNYAPQFKDESDGTGRRFLAFQLLTGYKARQSDDKPEDLSFIQDELIYNDDFKSACLKYILDTVDMSIDIPKSVQEDADSILSKENEIQELIDDKIRNIIDEPLIIGEKDLYEIYKIEMASQNRKPTNIRNLTNFVKGLDKFKHGVYKVNRNNVHHLNMINNIAYVEGMLFSKILKKQDSTNATLMNLVTKHFSELMRQRDIALKKYIQQVLEFRNKDSKLSLSQIGRTMKNYYIILPNNEIYADYQGGNDANVFRQIANDQRDTFNLAIMKDENIDILDEIQNSNYNFESVQRLNNQLPFPIRFNVNDSFTHYISTKSTTSETDSFHDFLIK